MYIFEEYKRKLGSPIIVKYSDIYNNKDKERKYSAISMIKDRNGVYAFVDQNTKEFLYVGQSNTNRIFKRIQQHFQNKDTGGLRYKLSNKGISLDLLNASHLYIFTSDELDNDPREVLYLESYLIARERPKYNF